MELSIKRKNDLLITSYFSLLIYKGDLNQKNHYTEIQIFRTLDEDFSQIQIDGKNIDDPTNSVLSEIEDFTTKKLRRIIEFSILETKEFLEEEKDLTKYSSSIMVHLGNMTCFLDGQVNAKKINSFVQDLINQVCNIIL